MVLGQLPPPPPQPNSLTKWQVVELLRAIPRPTYQDVYEHYTTKGYLDNPVREEIYSELYYSVDLSSAKAAFAAAGIRSVRMPVDPKRPEEWKLDPRDSERS